jgi:hypothetical protein
MINTVTYYQVNPSSLRDECSLCLEELQHGGGVIGHTGEHPHHVHQKCLEAWMRVNPSCPYCMAPIESISSLPLQEKKSEALSLYNKKVEVLRLKLHHWKTKVVDKIERLGETVKHFASNLYLTPLDICFLFGEFFALGSGIAVILGALKVSTLISGTIPAVMLGITTASSIALIIAFMLTSFISYAFMKLLDGLWHAFTRSK